MGFDVVYDHIKYLIDGIRSSHPDTQQFLALFSMFLASLVPVAIVKYFKESMNGEFQRILRDHGSALLALYNYILCIGLAKYAEEEFFILLWWGTVRSMVVVGILAWVVLCVYMIYKGVVLLWRLYAVFINWWAGDVGEDILDLIWEDLPDIRRWFAVGPPLILYVGQTPRRINRK